MATAYKGYLMKIGNYIVPQKFMKAETFATTRNVQDLDSYRDNDGYLHRNALPHVPLSVTFETPDLKTDTEIEELMSNIRINYLSAIERSFNADVYVQETNEYVQQKMYMAGNPFNLYSTSENKVRTKSIKLEFVGY